LRLESLPLDVSREVRVAAEDDPVDWRILFDPITVSALAEELDVQWFQIGRHLIVLATGESIGTAPSELLDSLAAGAAFIASRFVASTRGISLDRPA
jgi:hypothetical protein